MHSLFQDLVHGARALIKKPGFTLMAVLSLGLGIGANAAIFSLLDAVLLKTLPVRSPEQLFLVEPNGGPQFKRSSKISLTAFENLRQQDDSFSAVCFFSYVTRISAQVNGQPEMADAQMVSEGFFPVLGINAVAGRTFLAEDDQGAGEPDVAVISYNYWQRRFAGSASAVGQTVVLNQKPFTIVGVTPLEFYGVIVGASPDIFLPSSAGERILPGRFHFRDSWLPFVLGRLKPGVSEAQAAGRATLLIQQADLASAGSDPRSKEQQDVQKQTFRLESARSGFNMLREEFSAPLRLLMALVGLVLLIACANVANLMMVRIASRRKEIAVRLALGSSRFRIIQSVLAESFLLVVLGGAFGLLLASWSNSLILTVFSSGRNPITANATLALAAPLDWRVVAFTAGVSLLSILLFGVAPALSATQSSVTDGLKDQTAASGVGRFRWSRMLVIAQVALSVVLLVGAGLFARSLAKLKNVDVGFRRDHVLVFSVDPQSINYEASQIRGLYTQMLERIVAIPGVQSATLSRQGLLSGGGTYGSIRIPGRPLPDGEGRSIEKGKDAEVNLPSLSQVGPRFFETLGMTLVRGRDFGPQDSIDAPWVAVVNETFARYYFGSDDPIGQYFDPGGPEGRLAQIVGIVKDAKARSVREQTQRAFYLPFLQNPGAWRETTFQVRTVGDPQEMVASIRREIHSINPNLAIFRVRTLEAQVDESLGQERLVTTLASLFGVLALVLASAGLFGVLSYSVNQRTREIGIRMALGADRGTVLSMILRQGLMLTLIGLGFGLAGALVATKYLESLETMLYGVTPRDPLTYLLAGAALVLAALAACLLPARRAAKVDPLVALRYE